MRIQVGRVPKPKVECVRTLWKTFHFSPMFSFNTFEKHQQKVRFSDDFRGYWKGIERGNGLISNNKWTKTIKYSKLVQPKSVEAVAQMRCVL